MVKHSSLAHEPPQVGDAAADDDAATKMGRAELATEANPQRNPAPPPRLKLPPKRFQLQKLGGHDKPDQHDR